MKRNSRKAVSTAEAVSTAKDINKDVKSISKGRKDFKPGPRKASGVREGNDFSYWNQYPDLMGNAVKFPWYYIGGTQLAGKFLPTSFLRIDYVGTPGYSENSASAFNVQIRNLWLEMHRKFRGIGTYEPADLGIAIFCIIDIFERIAELERIYGLLSGYPVNNRSIPVAAMQAMGFSINFAMDVAKHSADFRYGINRLIAKCDQLCLPRGLRSMYNRIAMAGFLYADAKTTRASAIAYVPWIHYRWSGTALSTGSAALVEESLSAFVSSLSDTYEDALAYVGAAIDSLLSDTDIARMCSDLIACYGEAGVDKLASLAEDYKILPTYSAVILNKIHNLETIGLNADLYCGNVAPDANMVQELDSYGFVGNTPQYPNGDEYKCAVYQYNGIVLFKPYLSLFNVQSTSFAGMLQNGNGFALGEKSHTTSDYVQLVAHVCDTWEDDPSQETRCDAALHKNIGVADDISDASYTGAVEVIKSVGPEMIVNFTITELEMGNARVSYDFRTYMGSGASMSPAFCNLSKVDWHPLVHLHANTRDFIFGDCDNVVTMPDEVIYRVHDAAILSAFKFGLGGNQPSADLDSK